jgi:Lon protease-like protein
VSTLRLFPLRTVLFPGQTLALQVFEERYRILVSECLASGEPFGVVLIRSGHEVGGDAVPFEMGTTALIENVAPVADGRLAVTARGVQRFRIVRTDDSQPYLSAEVEYPVDEATEPPDDLVEEIAERYRQLRRLRHTVEGTWVREVPVPDTPGGLADAIGGAAAGVVEARQLQPLLEELDVRRRLERMGNLLTVVLEVAHRQARQAVAQRWGGPERTN